MKTSPRSGSTLLISLSVIATLSVCAGGAFTYTQMVRRNVERSIALDQATEVANGALELAYGSWRALSREQPNSALSTDALAAVPLPAAVDFPSIPNFSATRAAGTATVLSNYKVVAVDPQLNVMASSAAEPTPSDGRGGLKSYTYLATADVTLPARGGSITAKVRRVFQKETSSPWNFAIFYQDALEIHPGPSFKVTGWVHTNDSLYTGHSSLEFGSKATYSDDWYVGFKPGDGSHSSETPSSATFPKGLPPTQKTAQQPFGLDPSKSFDTTDDNPNNDSYHEYLEIPVSGHDDPLIDQNSGDSVRFYNQADIKVLVGADNTITVKNRAGDTVDATSTGNAKALYDSVSAALTTDQTIQDNREGAKVRLVTLDVGVLNDGLNKGGKKVPFNGVVYIADTSASGSSKRGVRLKNGAILPSGGLTVASSNPIYIQGDYNTGSAAGKQPDSNTKSDPTKPTVSGYDRVPSAVMGDAVMVLSNDWKDENSGGALSTRKASNTTVNTAILSGIVPTTTGDYSGGAENFPRFLEDWAGKTLTYYGSMVELFKSEQNTGKWGKANVYGAPTRRWYFDNNFFIKAPPGTFALINYNKSRWFTE